MSDDAVASRPRRRRASGEVTLRDVARAAGVGTSTVSRVIRKVGPVTEETREAVESAIRRLGYAPNRVAGALASVDSSLIGVVIPSTRFLFFLDVLRGIHAAMQGTPYRAVIAESGYDLLSAESAIRSLLGWRPAAMLVTGCDHTLAAREMLRNCRCRVIEMLDADAEPIDTSVGYSSTEVGQKTVDHMIGRGYRRLAYVGHPIDRDMRVRRKFTAMERRLGDHGLRFVATQFSYDFSSVRIGRSVTEQLHRLHPEIDGVVYGNDTLAMGGAFYCMAAGVGMPQDLGLFGFGAIDIGQELPQALSTLDNRRYEIGFRAVREAIEHPERPASPQRIDTGLRVIPGETA